MKKKIPFSYNLHTDKCTLACCSIDFYKLYTTLQQAHRSRNTVFTNTPEISLMSISNQYPHPKVNHCHDF